VRGLFPEVDLGRALRRLTDDPPKSSEGGPGGVVHVPWSSMIGGRGCWCGQPYGHDWPGKDDGAPHPPYPQ
jgi:hypothetical protein